MNHTTETICVPGNQTKQTNALSKALALHAFPLAEDLLELPIAWENEFPEIIHQLIFQRRGKFYNQSEKASFERVMIHWVKRYPELSKPINVSDYSWRIDMDIPLAIIFRSELNSVLRFLQEEHPLHLSYAIKTLQEQEPSLLLNLIKNNSLFGLELLFSESWAHTESQHKDWVEQAVSIQCLELLKKNGVDFSGRVETAAETILSIHDVAPIPSALKKEMNDWFIKEKESELSPATLIYMISNNPTSQIKKIVKIDSDLTITNEHGQSLLTIALLSGKFGTADFLSKSGLDWLQSDSFGLRPLDYLFSNHIKSRYTNSDAQLKNRMFWIHKWEHMTKMALGPEHNVLQAIMNREHTNPFLFEFDHQVLEYLIEQTSPEYLQNINFCHHLIQKTEQMVHPFNFFLTDHILLKTLGHIHNDASMENTPKYLRRIGVSHFISDLCFNKELYSLHRRQPLKHVLAWGEQHAVVMDWVRDKTEPTFIESVIRNTLIYNQTPSAYRSVVFEYNSIFPLLTFASQMGWTPESDINDSGATVWDQWVASVPFEQYNSSYGSYSQTRTTIEQRFGIGEAFLFDLSILPHLLKSQIREVIMQWTDSPEKTQILRDYFPKHHLIFSSREAIWSDVRKTLNSLYDDSSLPLWAQIETTYLSLNNNNTVFPQSIKKRL